MKGDLSDVRWALLSADEALDQKGVRRFSIAPGREYATSLLELGDRHLFDLPPSGIRPWGDLMVRLAMTMLRNFPDNVCWDLDAVAAHFARLAAGRAASVELSRAAYRLEGLHKMFGKYSVIRFRYVHDLTIGFDWARWVRKDPDERGEVGPYDLEFFKRMAARGQELTAAIAAGSDSEYPRLPPGVWRNPFPFRREPLDELQVLRAMAGRDTLPIRVWQDDPKPRWQLDYNSLREEEARQAGLEWEAGLDSVSE